MAKRKQKVLFGFTLWPCSHLTWGWISGWTHSYRWSEPAAPFPAGAQPTTGWMPHGTFLLPWTLTKLLVCILAEDVVCQDLNFGFPRGGSVLQTCFSKDVGENTTEMGSLTCKVENQAGKMVLMPLSRCGVFSHQLQLVSGGG